MKKYIVEDHSDGKKYEVITDELGYIRDKQPMIAELSSAKSKPEVKPVSFKDIERLYKKEFPESQSQPVNEVLRLRKLIDNAKTI